MYHYEMHGTLKTECIVHLRRIEFKNTAIYPSSHIRRNRLTVCIFFDPTSCTCTIRKQRCFCNVYIPTQHIIFTCIFVSFVEIESSCLHLYDFSCSQYGFGIHPCWLENVIAVHCSLLPWLRFCYVQ